MFIRKTFAIGFYCSVACKRGGAIRFVTPQQLHDGAGTAWLARRRAVYEEARALLQFDVQESLGKHQMFWF